MKTLTIIAAVALILHGLIHLLGTMTYLRLGAVQGLAYKTALLSGRWNIGENGAALYGVLWALAAGGFVVAAIALLAGWEWFRLALLAAATLSLILTVLDWQDARAGAILNVVILIVLGISPLFTQWFTR